MAPSMPSSPEVRAWQELAERCQQEIREKLYGNREYDLFEMTACGKSLLRKKISYAMFGPPESETLDLNARNATRLSKIFNLVCTKNAGQKSFRISFVCVECLTRDTVFYSWVIRLHLSDVLNEKIVKSVFIDDVPRSYDDFDDYIANNCLSKCIMCYPATGAYFLQTRKKKFQVKFRKSPACNVTKRILRGYNFSLLAKRLVECLLSASCLFCPWYKRGCTNDEEETLGLRSLESRKCWLAIGGLEDNVPSVRDVIAVRQAQQIGSKIARPVGNAPFPVSLKVSGLGVVKGVATIVQKLLEGKSVVALDFVYLVSATFLFANVMLTSFHANILIKEMLNNGVKPENFLIELVVLVRKRPEFGRLANPNQVVNLATLGIFFTLPEPKADLQTSCKAICKLITANAKQYATKVLSAADYATRIRSELYEFWSAFGYEMQAMVEYFCKIKGKKALCEVFSEITSHEALEFTNCIVVLTSWFRDRGGDKNALERLARVIRFQEQYGTVKPKDGAVKITEEYQQIGELLKIEFLEQKKLFQEGFENSKKFIPSLTESIYKDTVKISGPLNEHFCENALIQMTKAFSSQTRNLKVVKKRLKATSSCLEDIDTGTTVHFFHGLPSMSSDQYFSVVCEKVSSVLDNGASFEVDYRSRVGIFQGVQTNTEGIPCVIVTCVPEEESVAGNIFVVRCKID